MKNLGYFIVPMILSALLIPLVKQIGFKYGIYATENERTVHHGKIVRIGGVAIFIAFMIASLVMLRHDRTFDGLLVGATIIFVEGLIDDIFNIKPIFKIVGQLLAASAAIFIGNMSAEHINLIFGISIGIKPISYLIIYAWMIGIMNAVNLIDGLDGLAGGFSIIVLLTIALLCSGGRPSEMVGFCLILAGATMGFLFYNFHPASIFMGDCGSQLLGFMIASISICGFKKATFITLAVPIILLLIPISDVFLAIIRRKLKGQRITDPDKSHLHHILMNNMRLGQRGAVLTIYVVTALCGVTAYVFTKNERIGTVMLFAIILLFDLFIEYTGMVSSNYRPILKLLDKFKQTFDKKSEN